MLSYAVTHPWDLPALIALRVGASKATGALERFLKAYLPMTVQTAIRRKGVALDRR